MNSLHRVYVFFICVFILLLAVNCPALAADLLWRLTHGDQDSLVIGEVKKVAGEIIELKVAHVISGRPTKGLINVEVKEEDLQRIGQEIKDGDKLVLSLNLKGGRYSIKWGIYKVSSLDYKSLKILAPNQWPGDMAALQWYINSNGKDNDFYFKEGAVFVRDNSGGSRQIYPLPASDSKISSEPVKPAPAQPVGLPALGVGVALFAVWLIVKKKFHSRV